MFATALHAYAEGFAFQLIAILNQRFLKISCMSVNGTSSTSRIWWIPGIRVRASRIARRWFSSLRELRCYPSGGRQRASHHSALKRYECSRKDFYKAQAHRLAFDGDFGNNLMINFMAAMVRWQALSDLYREKYSSPHLRLRSRRGSIPLTSLCCAHHLTIARYLLFALSPLP